MELYERIRDLRKNALNLSQTEFGARLGVSRSVIANIETNVLARPEQKEPIIKLICKTFNVSYDWLTTGEGEMYVETKQTFVERLAAEFSLGEHATKIMACYVELNDEQRGAVDYFLKMVADSFANAPAAPQGAESEVVDVALNKTIDLYRAARSEDNTEHEIITDSDGKIDRLKKLPKVTSKDDF